MKVCFHIGFPKSASTTLQKHLFDKHREINFLGIFPTANIGQESNNYINENNLFLKYKELQSFHKLLTEKDSLEYFFDKKDFIYKYLKQDKLNLFSNERFASVLFSYPDRVSKANRIKELFSNAKILIVIRNYIDIIKSQYRDHPFDPRCITTGKGISIEEWIDIHINSDDINFFKSIKYSEIIEYYNYLFGKENVKVVLFEDLVDDLDFFVKEISNFLDINYNESLNLLKGKKENIGISKKLNIYRKLKRNISDYVPSVLKNFYIKKLDKWMFEKLKNGKKAKIKINFEYRQKIYDYFKEDVEKLLKMGLNIKNKGYFQNE